MKWYQRWAQNVACEFGPGWKAEWRERVRDDAYNCVTFLVVLEKQGTRIEKQVDIDGEMNTREGAFQARMEAKRRLLTLVTEEISSRQ